MSFSFKEVKFVNRFESKGKVEKMKEILDPPAQNLAKTLTSYVKCFQNQFFLIKVNLFAVLVNPIPFKVNPI